MKRSISFLLSVCALFALAAPVLAADSPAMTQAMADYKSRKYRDALTKLDGIVRTGQANDKAHYYKALCYQGINQMSTARNEYMWVYSNGRDPTLKYNAWQALTSMDRWSQHRDYAGQGNAFDRASPQNVAGQEFREKQVAEARRIEAEEAAAARQSSGGG